MNFVGRNSKNSFYLSLRGVSAAHLEERIMKKNYYYIFMCLFISIPFIIQLSGCPKKEADEAYLKLYNSAIKNEISFVGYRDHGSSFRVLGDDYNYVFYPVGYGNTNVKYPFVEIAAVGDSIVKQAHTNKLKLVTADTLYEYDFLDVLNN